MALQWRGIARAILAVVTGYAVSAVYLACSFLWAYFLLGEDWVPPPASDELWWKTATTTIVFEFMASCLGGFACAHIASRWRPVNVFAVMEFVISLGLSVLLFSIERAEPGETHFLEPPWMTFFEPFLSAAAILLGGLLALGRPGRERRPRDGKLEAAMAPRA